MHWLQKNCIQSIYTKGNTKFCLSLHYNEANSYLFFNGTEIIKFKAKYSEISGYPLCLGNISKDRSVGNMKKTGLKGYVYDFSVDYDAIAVSDILDIRKYLMRKMTQYKMFIKKCFFTAMMFFGCNLSSVNSLKCVSMNNQSSGSCNNINDPYAKLCVPDVVKNMKIVSVEKN